MHERWRDEHGHVMRKCQKSWSSSLRRRKKAQRSRPMLSLSFSSQKASTTMAARRRKAEQSLKSSKNVVNKKNLEEKKSSETKRNEVASSQTSICRHCYSCLS